MEYTINRIYLNVVNEIISMKKSMLSIDFIIYRTVIKKKTKHEFNYDLTMIVPFFSHEFYTTFPEKSTNPQEPPLEAPPPPPPAQDLHG